MVTKKIVEIAVVDLWKREKEKKQSFLGVVEMKEKRNGSFKRIYKEKNTESREEGIR